MHNKMHDKMHDKTIDFDIGINNNKDRMTITLAVTMTWKMMIVSDNEKWMTKWKLEWESADRGENRRKRMIYEDRRKTLKIIEDDGKS